MSAVALSVIAAVHSITIDALGATVCAMSEGSTPSSAAMAAMGSRPTRASAAAPSDSANVAVISISCARSLRRAASSQAADTSSKGTAVATEYAASISAHAKPSGKEYVATTRRETTAVTSAPPAASEIPASKSALMASMSRPAKLSTMSEVVAEITLSTSAVAGSSVGDAGGTARGVLAVSGTAAGGGDAFASGADTGASHSHGSPEILRRPYFTSSSPLTPHTHTSSSSTGLP